MAHCEAFILNYNGSRFLRSCLHALRKTVRGDHTLGVTVVDNASQDDSKTLVQHEFPEVAFIELEENYGFSKGNNEGVWRRASQLERSGKKLDYVVFLNNDTEVTSTWFQELVSYAESNPHVGVLGSKSLFLNKFIVVDVEASHVMTPAETGESTDSRELSAFISGVLKSENRLEQDPRRHKFLNDFYGWENGGQWLGRKGRMLLALPAEYEPHSIELDVTALGCLTEPLTLQFSIKSGRKKQSTRTLTLEPGENQTVTFKVAREQMHDVIQNAGSFFRPEKCEGGDRGMFEVDEGQFEQTEPVDSVCGVSMMLRYPLFRELGGFDETFFAYYEDTDLSLRVKEKGKDAVYVGSSVLRHVHAGSGGEYSDYFNFQVAFSQSVMSSKVLSPSAWRKKMSGLRTAAWRELDQFEIDGNLENKAMLKAYARLWKKAPRILANRFRYTVKSTKNAA